VLEVSVEVVNEFLLLHASGLEVGSLLVEYFVVELLPVLNLDPVYLLDVLVVDFLGNDSLELHSFDLNVLLLEFLVVSAEVDQFRVVYLQLVLPPVVAFIHEYLVVVGIGVQLCFQVQIGFLFLGLEDGVVGARLFVVEE